MEVELKGLKLICQCKQSFLTKQPLGGKEKKKNLAGHAYKSYSWDVCLG